jgi:putative addiction module component (TIGR02574 family)
MKTVATACQLFTTFVVVRWYHLESVIQCWRRLKMSDYQSLFADASQLPVGERLHLIESLWDTLPDDAAPTLSPEWLAEIERRSAEYDAGLVKPIPWETIRAESLRRLNGAG